MSRPVGQRRLRLWRQLKARRSYRWSIGIVGLLLFLAIFCRFLANDKPIWCQHEGETYWPVFHEIGYNWGIAAYSPELRPAYWRRVKPKPAIWPLVPYAPSTQDISNHYKGPFEDQKVDSWRQHHWLGTHSTGQDILAALIWGSRTTLKVGLLSMLIAAFIGISLGALAGFFGNHGWRLSRARLLGMVIGLLAGWFYGFTSRQYALQEIGGWRQWLLSIFILVAGIWLCERLFHWIWRGASGRKAVTVPLDGIVMRLIEVLNSIPALLLLLAMVGMVKERSLSTVIVIIGLLSWTTMARFIRSELLRIRRLEYIDAARTLGISRRRILLRHALPNALGPALITLAFGIAAAVLLEAYLSFLGLGIPDQLATWGTLLANVREQPSAWWLAVFPGLAIFLTITAFNLLGESLTEMRGRR